MYSDTSSLYSHIDTDKTYNDVDKTYNDKDTDKTYNTDIDKTYNDTDNDVDKTYNDKDTDKTYNTDTDIDLILECYTYQTYLQLPLKQNQIKTLHKKWIGQIEQIKTIKKKKSIIKSFYDLLTK
jgi:hypothetical protein